MDNKKTENKLKRLARQQSFDPVDDRLTELISRYRFSSEDELLEEDLDYVAAASATPEYSYQEFEKLVKKMEHNQRKHS